MKWMRDLWARVFRLPLCWRMEERRRSKLCIRCKRMKSEHSTLTHFFEEE